VASSALWPGTFNFALFSLSHLNGNLTWKHPTPAEDGLSSLVAGYVIAGTMMAGLVWHVRAPLSEIEGKDEQ
jgi:hypothetical protein